MSAPVDRSLPRTLRLRRGAEFERVFARRASAGDGRLIVYACENGQEQARLGLSVSRKIGGAVQRNRWKRRLREVFRLSRGELPGGVDLVLVPKRGEPPELDESRRALVQLATRATSNLNRSSSYRPGRT